MVENRVPSEWPVDLLWVTQCLETDSNDPVFFMTQSVTTCIMIVHTISNSGTVFLRAAHRVDSRPASK